MESILTHEQKFRQAIGLPIDEFKRDFILGEVRGPGMEFFLLQEERNRKLIILPVIAKKKFWWPGTQELQLAWWTNYPIALETNKVALAATVTELAKSVADSLMFLALYENEPAFRDWVALYMQYRKDIINGKTQANIGGPPALPTLTFPANVVMGMMQRTFAYIIALKKRTGFNDLIGTALKVNGLDYPPFDEEAYIANGKGKGLTDYIKLTFDKGPYIEEMETFRQRGTDTAYHSIGSASKSGKKDKDLNLVANQPEVRSYYNRAIINNEYVGAPSPVYKVTWISPLPPPPPPPIV